MQSRSIGKKTITVFSIWTVCLLLMVSCKVNKNTKAVLSSTAYIQVAKEKLGDKVKFIANQDKTLMLCEGEHSSNPNDPRFSFLIYDVKAEKILMEKTVRSGYVQWLSNSEIEVFLTPGTMRNDQSRDEFTTVYDVTTGKSTPKTDWKK